MIRKEGGVSSPQSSIETLVNEGVSFILGEKGFKQSKEQGMLGRLRNRKETRMVERVRWEVSQGGGQIIQYLVDYYFSLLLLSKLHQNLVA